MKKKIINLIIGVIVCFCLLIIIGDKSPETTWGQFVAVKAAGFAALFACGKAYSHNEQTEGEES